MNQQQKKFAVTRVFDIICQKVKVIHGEDTALSVAHSEVGHTTLYEFAQTILCGNTLPKKLSDDRSNFIDGNTKLSYIFDIQNSHDSQAAIDFREKHELSWDAGLHWRAGLASIKISVRHPMEAKARDENILSIYSSNNQVRISNAINALTTAADKIILGTDSEAIDAIAAIGKMTF